MLYMVYVPLYIVSVVCVSIYCIVNVIYGVHESLYVVSVYR